MTEESTMDVPQRALSSVSSVGAALDFDALRRVNSARSDEWETRDPAAADWNLAEWGCALAGEVGELCNLLKKKRRGEYIADDDIADEIADVAIYLDLLAYKAGIDLGEAIRRKFNRDSAKRGFPHALRAEGNVPPQHAPSRGRKAAAEQEAIRAEYLRTLRERLLVEREAGELFKRDGMSFDVVRLMLRADRMGPPQHWMIDPANEAAMHAVWNEVMPPSPSDNGRDEPPEDVRREQDSKEVGDPDLHHHYLSSGGQTLTHRHRGGRDYHYGRHPEHIGHDRGAYYSHPGPAPKGTAGMTDTGEGPTP